MASPLDAPEVRRHLDDIVVWLTTVTDRGAPSPTPVWFVRDGDEIVTYSEPDARKVQNLRERPAATLHFNSDRDGQDVVVLHVDGVVEDDHRPSETTGYLDKYRDGLATWDMTAEQFDAATTVRIRLRVRSVWLGPSS